MPTGFFVAVFLGHFDSEAMRASMLLGMVVVSMFSSVFGASPVRAAEPATPAVAALTATLEAKGWMALGEVNSGRIPYVGADQVFLDPTFRQVLMVRLGAVSFQGDHPQFAQGKLSNGTPYTVFLHGLSEGPRSDLRSWIQGAFPGLKVSQATSQTPSVWAKAWDRAFPSACAGEPCGQPNCAVGPQGLGEHLAESLMGPAGQALAIAQPELFKTFRSCVVNGLEGSWSATGGAVVEGAKGIWNAAKNPAQAARQLGQQADTISKFFQALQPNLVKLWNGVKALPPEQAREMVCNFVGAIGTDILVAALLAPETMGGSLAVMGARMTQYVNKALRAIPLLENLAKVAGEGKILAQNAVRALGKVTDKVLDQATALSKNGMPRLAGALVSCAR